MERLNEQRDELIELEVASTATMGPGGEPLDEFAGQERIGLTDD